MAEEIQTKKITPESSAVLYSRRHPCIQERLNVIKLISDSYFGGNRYLKGGHLFQYPNEHKRMYRARLRRAAYWNFVQPIADMMVGFIFAAKPERTIGADINYIIEKASKKKGLQSFMETVAIHALLYSCGVLVTTPDFNEEDVKTKADEQRLGIRPYCVLYKPEQIRDFCIDDDGDLEWILLDDSYINKDDPMEEAKTITAYSLWTKDEYYRIEFEDDHENKGTIVASSNHKIGEVPFIFCNSKDMNDDSLTESIFEDIALTSRTIFNLFSYLEEMSASSTFQVLIFPVDDVNNLPASLLKQGLGALPVVPCPKDSKPYFAKAQLDGADRVISYIEILIKSILQKVGFDKESEQNYVQSGKAKNIEFQKTESVLRLLATQLENVENKIFYYARKWGSGSDGMQKDTVVYPQQFQSEENEKKLERLYDVFNIPIQELRSMALEKIIKLNFPDEPEKNIKKIIKSFEQKEADRQQNLSSDINGLINDEKTARNTTQNSDDSGEV